MIWINDRERAYIAPFAVFILLMAVGMLVRSVGAGYAAWPLAHPEHWFMPLQAVVCGWLLWRDRALRSMGPWSGWALAGVVGAAALALWIAPQAWLGFPPRLDGFNPLRFGDGGPFWLNVSLRFIRLVIIVPLLEEIFWRGFVFRYCISQDFERVAPGTWTMRALVVTTVGFCLEHSFADWPAAVLTGLLYNLVYIRTRSIWMCVVAHAVTNLLLGFFILKTGQWGFW